MNIKETLTALLPGVEISEDFVTRLTASIEAAVVQRVEEETKDITEKYDAYKKELDEKASEFEEYSKSQIKEVSDKANAYAEYVVEEMTKKVEDYCEYVIEKFVEEQKTRLVESADYARMSKVLRTIREAFEENYFQLSEEPANKSLETKLQESNKAYNELFEDHRILKKQIADYSAYVDKENRKTIFETLTIGLADTQKEKIEKLIEKANFETLDEFESGVKLMAEEIIQNQETKPVEAVKESKEKSTTVSKVIEENNTDRMKTYLERL